MRLDVDPTNHHPFLFTLERGQRGVATWDLRTLVVLAVIVAGAACYRRVPPVARAAHLGALVALALGAVVHGLYGKELLLYTQHWQVAALVLVAGAVYLPRPSRRGLAVGLGALVLAVTINNAVLLRGMLAALERR